ncbi:MAG: coenzyme F430 synthase [archaeon]|nr:coenzyme F430 synthase [archaeon]
MKILILDLTHGGDILAEEFRGRGDSVTCVDVYHNTSDDKRLHLMSIGVEVLDEVSEGWFDLVLSPAHCPDEFLNGMKYREKKTFSGAVKMLAGEDVFRVEVTGVKGKTSTCYLLAHILDYAGKKIFLHTSRGQGPYVNGVHRIEKIMSIAPPSLLRLPKDGYDINVAEVSLGGSGKANISVITNLLEDYGIAKNTRRASGAKSEIFGDGVNIVRSDEVNIWSSISNYELRPFDEVTGIVGSPRIGEKVQIVFSYNGGIHKAVLDSSYLSVQYVPSIDTVLSVCSELRIKVDHVIGGLESFRGVPGRGEISKDGDLTYIIERNPGISHMSVRKTLESLKKMDGLNRALVIVNPVSKKVCDKMRCDLISEVTKEYGIETIFTDGVDNCVDIPPEKETIIKFVKEGFQ